MSTEAEVQAEIQRLQAPDPASGTFRNKSLVLNKPNGTTSTGTSGTATPVASTSALLPADSTTTKGDGNGSATEKGKEKEFVIDGVTFVTDPRGHKLVRKSGSTTPSLTPATASPNSTPKRTTVSGTSYVRTKNGNLVSLEFANKKKEEAEKKRAARLDAMVGVGDGEASPVASSSGRGRGGARGRGSRGRGKGRSTFGAPTRPKSTKLCRYFQRTGQCSQALTCPYVHNSKTVSLCLPSLRTPSACPHPPSLCLLSHTPLPQRTPHCLHFPNCSNANCPYVHVLVSEDADLCEDFARLGWCEKGEKCEKRHRSECFRFWKEGVCKVKGCKEMHVLRRRGEEAGVERVVRDVQGVVGKRGRDEGEEDGWKGISSGGRKGKKPRGLGQDSFVPFDGEEEEGSDEDGGEEDSVRDEEEEEEEDGEEEGEDDDDVSSSSEGSDVEAFQDAQEVNEASEDDEEEYIE